TYNITTDEVWTSGSKPWGKTDYCQKCTFNIAEGVVVTINSYIVFDGATINGGTFNAKDRKVELWSNNGTTNFNNTKFNFTGTSEFTGNGPVALTNSTFTFAGTSNMLSNHSLVMKSSSMVFNQQSYFIGQGSKVDLTGSTLIAGDGSLTSKAYVQMNGAKLNLLDATSGVQVMNANNYYYNWGSYYSKPANTNISTNDNKKNCGTIYPNACQTQFVYGPIAMTSGGYTAPLILPVIIRDFVATASANSVNISWSTQQESNSAFFAIERSTDGNNWNQVGQVKAAGNSAKVIRYSFTDLNLVNGSAHYRLKMVDADNKFAYSDVKSIRSSSIASVKVYPNPATDYANITLDAKAGNSIIRLINQSGQVVSEKSVAANSGTVVLPLQQFQNGTYALRISDDKGADQTIKLLVYRGR
ncbi:MAG: T9SS type A sorting domain-containing protein, partial [Pedobacter sp.]